MQDADSTYDTVNGPRTLIQMSDELHAAGWTGTNDQGQPEDALTAYARTTGGPVTLHVTPPPVALAHALTDTATALDTASTGLGELQRDLADAASALRRAAAAAAP